MAITHCVLISCGGRSQSGTQGLGTFFPPPSSHITYPQTSMVLEVGQPFAANIPSYFGSLASFSISPSLPAGLTLDGNTGAVYGVPSASSTSHVYTVSASNEGKSATAALTLVVNPRLATLLDLGAANVIVNILSSNGNVVVQDYSGHWVLINYASGTQIASGEQGGDLTYDNFQEFYRFENWPLDMAGPTLAVGISNGLEVRSASDGHLLSVITSPMIDPFGAYVNNSTWWRLASDGSYICAGSSAGLIAWSTSGNVLFTRAGNYSNANVFAGPGKIQVALGPAGANVIETLLVLDGSPSVGLVFSGSFNTWFLDGSRFLTNLSNGVWTYDNNSVQQSLVTLPTFDVLGGEGNWMWTIVSSTGAVTVYRIGSSNAAGSYSYGYSGMAIASANTLALLSEPPSLQIIDLSGENLSQNTYAVPTAHNSAYAAISSSVWLVGNDHGTVVDGASVSTTPRFLTQGTAFDIAGSTSAVAVAVANGTIYTFKPSITTPQQSINFSSSHVELSDDATVLGAAANTQDYQYLPDRTLNVYALPAATLTHSWPYQILEGSTGENVLFGFSLAGAGTNIGQSSGIWDGTAWHFLRQVTAVTGGPLIWSDNPSIPTTAGFFPSPPLLSPNGDLIAATSDVRTPSTVSTIYNNGTAVTTVPGFAVGWIDDNQVLVDSYVADQFGYITYSGCTIYSPTGAVLSSPPLPEIQSFQTVSPGADLHARHKHCLFHQHRTGNLD